MKSKPFCKLVKVILAILVILTTLIPFTSFAVGTPPTTINAPLNFGAANYGGHSVVCTLSAPDDLRALISQTTAERGYGLKILGQVDFKVDNGGWHYTADWDNSKTFLKYTLNYYNALTGGVSGKFLGKEDLSFKNMFPTDTNVPVPLAFTSWDWYKSHSMTLRARFALDLGSGNIVFSDWSSEYVLSAGIKMDYKKILADNPPVLKSSTIEKKPLDQRPYLVLQLDRHPDEIQKLNAAAGCKIGTEIWLRRNGDKDFKKIGMVFITDEIIRLDVSAYFGKNLQSYEAESYEIKARYQLDERGYEQSGTTSFNLLYTPYSNTLAYNMPAWTGASKWATPELEKASEMGLIPDILKGQDMTKNITREEFAEVSLLMYEKASGITNTTPVSPNPFIDTKNPQILKAFKLGIAKGVSATEFLPMDLINREQVAAMLARTIRIIAPNADYSTAGAPTFADKSDISGWALNDCLYMSKIGIIKGTDGKFMPKAISDAQKAVGYANTSREQALAMSVRSVNKINEIK